MVTEWCLLSVCLWCTIIDTARVKVCINIVSPFGSVGINYIILDLSNCAVWWYEMTIYFILIPFEEPNETIKYYTVINP